MSHPGRQAASADWERHFPGQSRARPSSGSQRYACSCTPTPHTLLLSGQGVQSVTSSTFIFNLYTIFLQGSPNTSRRSRRKVERVPSASCVVRHSADLVRFIWTTLPSGDHYAHFTDERTEVCTGNKWSKNYLWPPQLYSGEAET